MQVRLQGQEVKSAALREQAQSHTQRVESLESCIQVSASAPASILKHQISFTVTSVEEV